MTSTKKKTFTGKTLITNRLVFVCFACVFCCTVKIQLNAFNYIIIANLNHFSSLVILNEENERADKNGKML